MNFKEKIYIYVSLLYIAYQIFPLFSHLSHLPIWFVPILITLILIILYPKSHTTNCFNYFLGYFVILLIYGLSQYILNLNQLGYHKFFLNLHPFFF